jgi:hypothetical protein
MHGFDLPRRRRSLPDLDLSHHRHRPAPVEENDREDEECEEYGNQDTTEQGKVDEI